MKLETRWNACPRRREGASHAASTMRSYVGLKQHLTGMRVTGCQVSLQRDCSLRNGRTVCPGSQLLDPGLCGGRPPFPPQQWRGVQNQAGHCSFGTAFRSVSLFCNLTHRSNWIPQAFGDQANIGVDGVCIHSTRAGQIQIHVVVNTKTKSSSSPRCRVS